MIKKEDTLEFILDEIKFKREEFIRNYKCRPIYLFLDKKTEQILLDKNFMLLDIKEFFSYGMKIKTVLTKSRLIEVGGRER